MSRIYTSADQLIGHTPLLELTHIEEGLGATILAKLEYFNSSRVQSSSNRLPVTPALALPLWLLPAVTASSS